MSTPTITAELEQLTLVLSSRELENSYNYHSLLLAFRETSNDLDYAKKQLNANNTEIQTLKKDKDTLLQYLYNTESKKTSSQFTVDAIQSFTDALSQYNETLGFGTNSMGLRNETKNEEPTMIAEKVKVMLENFAKTRKNKRYTPFESSPYDYTNKYSHPCPKSRPIPPEFQEDIKELNLLYDKKNKKQFFEKFVQMPEVVRRRLYLSKYLLRISCFGIDNCCILDKREIANYLRLLSFRDYQKLVETIKFILQDFPEEMSVDIENTFQQDPMVIRAYYDVNGYSDTQLCNLIEAHPQLVNTFDIDNHFAEIIIRNPAIFPPSIFEQKDQNIAQDALDKLLYHDSAFMKLTYFDTTQHIPLRVFIILKDVLRVLNGQKSIETAFDLMLKTKFHLLQHRNFALWQETFEVLKGKYRLMDGKIGYLEVFREMFACRDDLRNIPNYEQLNTAYELIAKEVEEIKSKGPHVPPKMQILPMESVEQHVSGIIYEVD